MPQQQGAHHRRQRQRDEGRDQDRDGQGDSELAEQPSDDVAHEQQRDQHGNQRNRQRNDGEADLPGALQRGLQRRVAFFDVALDVLDHHDGVVHHEAGGDGQRHQRKIVERVAQQVHHAEGADQRQRHRDAGNDGRRQRAQEDEDHHHDQRDGQHHLELNVFDAGANGVGAVGQDGDLDRTRQVGLQLLQAQLDAVDNLDDVGARLPLDIDDDRRRGVHPRRLVRVLRALGLRWRRRRRAPGRHSCRR